MSCSQITSQWRTGASGTAGGVSGGLPCGRELADAKAPQRRPRVDAHGARTVASDSTRHGFSLVELMVVMVILGMLVGLAAVRYRSYLISSKQYTAKTQIANIVKAIETFYAQEGRYPTTDEGIEILAEGTTAWPDGYLDKVPLDPWKNPYEYIIPGSTEPYEVICLGADGREGGEGADRDISSESLDSDA